MMYKTNRFFFYNEDKEYYLSLIKNDYKEAYQAYHTWHYTGEGDRGIDKLIDLNKMMVSYGERSIVDYLKHRIKIEASRDAMDYLDLNYNEYHFFWCLLSYMDNGKEMAGFLHKISLITCRKFGVMFLVYYALMVIL